MTTRIWRALAALASLAPSFACGATSLPPAGQWVVHVETDAWLPTNDPANAARAEGLFQRLHVEVYDADTHASCTECARDFALDEDAARTKGISFGVAATPGRGAIARVVLFRADGFGGGTPRASSSIEAVVALSDPPSEGVRDVTVPLMVQTLGAPVGTIDAPIAPRAGLPDRTLPGTFHAEHRRACSGAAASDEACVPGGAFWYGDLSLYDSSYERLVVVGPFFVDKAEATVAAYRASGLPTGGDPAPADAMHPYCTYTNAPGANEALALNCVTAVRARPFCDAHGRHLPTEAQLAYLAGGLHARKYVWGKDDPACDDAVFERTTRRNAALYATCKDRGVGVAPPGTGARDRIELPDGDVVDVFGNLTELTRDAWQNLDEPCWTSPILVDPYCQKPGKQGYPLSAHGANWESVYTAGNAAVRLTFQSTTGFSRDEDTGFRCARESD